MWERVQPGIRHIISEYFILGPVSCESVESDYGFLKGTLICWFPAAFRDIHIVRFIYTWFPTSSTSKRPSRLPAHPLSEEFADIWWRGILAVTRHSAISVSPLRNRLEVRLRTGHDYFISSVVIKKDGENKMNK